MKSLKMMIVITAMGLMLAAGPGYAQTPTTQAPTTQPPATPPPAATTPRSRAQAAGAVSRGCEVRVHRHPGRCQQLRGRQGGNGTARRIAQEEEFRAAGEAGVLESHGGQAEFRRLGDERPGPWDARKGHREGSPRSPVRTAGRADRSDRNDQRASGSLPGEAEPGHRAGPHRQGAA